MSPREAPRQSNPGETLDPLEAIADELHAIGAESETARAVKRTVPWVFSVAVHVGILALALLVAGTVRLIQSEKETPVIVADFDALSYEPVTRLDVDRNADDERMVQDKVALDELEEILDDQLVALEVDPMSVISDAGGAASVADFQPRPMEGTASFVGLTTTNARRIVYVIDASGSLIASLQVVVQELSRSLESLTAKQEFGVIFFQQNRALAVPPPGRLIPATNQEKLRALQWIDDSIVPSGNSNPIPALEMALGLRPDVIFLLSDNITGAGRYEVDQADLLGLIDRMNPRDRITGRRATQINCIQFLDPDPLDTLARIAREHGGPRGYKFLDRRELGLAR